MDPKMAALPVVVWIGVGVAIGIATGNLAAWIGFGVIIGLMSAYFLTRRRGGPDA